MESGEDSICDLCGTDLNVSSKCTDCDEYLCGHCKLAHRRNKDTKKHVIDEANGKSNYTPDNVLCNIHAKQTIDMYCVTCNIPICSKCAGFIHNKHSYGQLKDVAKKKKHDMSKILTEFREQHISNLRSKIKLAQTYRQQNHDHGKKTLLEIDIRAKELEAEVHKYRERFTREFLDVQKQADNLLKQIESDMAKYLIELEKLHDAFLEVVSSASSLEIIKAEDGIYSKVEDVISGLNFNMRLHLTYFNPGKTDKMALQKSFGLFERGKKPSNDIKIDAPKVLKPPPKPFKVNINTAFNHQCGDILSLCPVGDNAAWIHRYNEYGNDLVDTTSQVLKSVEFDFFADDFSKMQDGGILVSSYGDQCIKKLEENGSVVDITKTDPLHPRGICIMRNGDILVCLMDDYTYDITDESRRHVARINMDGERIDTIEYDNENRRLFTLPYRVSENKNLDICVIDRTSDSSGRLVILDNYGAIKCIYNSNGDPKFIPNGVTCDAKGRIIISDYWDKIHILDNDGQLLQYLITEKNKIEYPQSIGIDNKGFLWVGCEAGNVYVLKYRE